MRLGRDTASLVNWVGANVRSPDPVPGMGATILCWTDRLPATVLSVGKTGKTLTFSEDKARLTGGSTMSESQEWAFERGSGPVQLAKRDRRGRWRACDAEDRMTGTVLVLGYREKYHDPTF